MNKSYFNDDADKHAIAKYHWETVHNSNPDVIVHCHHNDFNKWSFKDEYGIVSKYDIYFTNIKTGEKLDVIEIKHRTTATKDGLYCLDYKKLLPFQEDRKLMNQWENFYFYYYVPNEGWYKIELWTGEDYKKDYPPINWKSIEHTPASDFAIIDGEKVQVMRCKPNSKRKYRTNDQAPETYDCLTTWIDILPSYYGTKVEIN